MAADLVSAFGADVSDDTIGKIASIFGESRATTQAALHAAVPAVLAAAARKASTAQGAAELFNAVRQTTAAGGDSPIANLLTGGAGSIDLARIAAPVLSSLFGSRTSSIAEWIGVTAGTNSSSAGALLRLVAPVVLAFVGRQASADAGGLSVRSLTALLGRQASFFETTTRPGLAAAVLGVVELGQTDHTSVRPTGRAVDVISTATAAAPSGGTFKWLLSVTVAAIVLLFLALRLGRTPAESPAASAPVANAPATITSAYGVDLGALVTRVLPGGVELKLPEKGVELQLLGVIGDASQAVAPDTWFTLDRLEFETGSATLRPSAQEQLDNIAAILKAFPNVALKVGGYTDNVGDDAANLKLSQARAANAVQELTRLGVEPARLEAEGYGEAHPVDTNDTDAGRQHNRRIDVRVTRK